MTIRPKLHILALLGVSILGPTTDSWAQLTKIDIYPPNNIPGTLGTITPGAAGSFTITSDGTPFFSNVRFGDKGDGSLWEDETGDIATFAAETLVGDFDRRVEITDITNNGDPVSKDAWSRGALMVRVSEKHYSTSFQVIAGNPAGANQAGFAGRALDGQNYTWWGRPLPGVDKALPHQWLRLRRVGDSFSAYVGTNGTSWTLIGERYQQLPASLLVGPYASSSTAGVLTTVSFANYGATPTTDTEAPKLISAGTLDKKVVGVRFSETIESSSATKLENYEITQTGGAAVKVNSAKMGISGDAVHLTVEGLVSDTFAVKVIGGIKDSAGNAIAANTAVTARALNWNHNDIGLIQDPNNRPSVGDDPGTVGQAVMISSDENPEIEIIGGGSNQWNPGDFIHYVWRTEPLSGNFDVTVAVSRYDRPARTEGWGNSGIMLRAAPYLEGQEYTKNGTKVKHVVNSTYIEGAGRVGGPNRGSIPLWRTSDGGGYGNGNAGFSAYDRVIGGVKGYYAGLRGVDASGNVDPQSAPDTARYLRIKRIGTTYTFYASWNRTDWALVDGPVDLPTLPDELLLGFSTMGDTGAGDPPFGTYGGNGHQIDYDDPYNPLNSDQIFINGVQQKKGGVVQNESNYCVQRIKVFPNGVTDPLPKILEKVDIRPADGSSEALSGSWTTVGSSSFDMTGGGTGVFRNTGSADVGGDEVTFASETITGDFDKQVAISSLTSVLYNRDGTAIAADQVLTEPVPVDAWARAGLMVRSSTSAYSQLIKIVVGNPEVAGVDQVRVMGRGIDGQNYTQYSRNYAGVKANLPNQYIRMKRVGNAFTFYVSKDGVVWSLIGQTYQELPQTVLFGPYAAASLNPADTKGNPDGLQARTVVSFKGYQDVESGDVSGPVLVSAGTLDKKTIGLKFSEPVDSATVSVVGNYTLSQGTVTAARNGISGDSVYLTVEGLTSDTFTVTVNNLTDSTGNKIAADSTVSGKVTGLVSTDIGFIQNPDARPTPGDDPYRPGQAVATSSDDAPEVEIIGGGSNAWNPGDYLHYLYNPAAISGDFDVAVKLSRYDRPNRTEGWGNSGVMLRSAVYNPGEEFLNAGTKAPMVALTSYMEGAGPVGGPERGAIPLFRNTIHGDYGNGNPVGSYGNSIGGIKGYYGDLRAVDAAGTIAAESSAVSARWLRIQRVDSTYTFLASWDGLNWATVDTKSDLTLDRELPLLIGFSTMNDTGGTAPPKGGYGGNGHSIDPTDALNGPMQNESNYSVQKVRVFSDATKIGVAKAEALAGGKVSVSFSGTLQSAASVNGPWTTLTTSGSPFVVTPSAKSQRYFRVIP